MGNSLGAMVFIIGGIALGYWVLKGNANNFLQAVNAGNGLGQQSQQPTTFVPGGGNIGNNGASGSWNGTQVVGGSQMSGGRYLYQ